jgi:hypothetical protein
MNNVASRVLALAFLTLAVVACAGEDIADDDAGSTSAEVGVRPRFELWQDGAGQYHFHLLAANSEVLVTSEAYTTRTGALTGLLSVLDNGGLSTRYQVRTSASGKPYFVLRAANNQIIATSETYSSSAKARAGVNATIAAVAAYLEHWETAAGARFQVFAGADGRFYFDLHAQNGEIVLSSQGYDSEASALNGAFAVAEAGRSPAAYKVLRAADGTYYLNLVAPNNQVIATSETYATKANAERARDAIVALLPTVALL